MYTAELAVKTLEPTAQEDQLAEDYASILDTVAHIDRSLRDGEWHSVRDGLDQLISAAEDMWSSLSASDPGAEDPDEDFDDGRPDPALDTDTAKVRQLVAVYTEPHVIGRTLYPVSGIDDPQLRAAVEREDAGQDPVPEQQGVPAELVH